jgi:hypothetical protein
MMTNYGQGYWTAETWRRLGAFSRLADARGIAYWKRQAEAEHERAERLESMLEVYRGEYGRGYDLGLSVFRAERDEARQVAMQLLRLAKAQDALLLAQDEHGPHDWRATERLCLLDDAWVAMSPALRRLVEE